MSIRLGLIQVLCKNIAKSIAAIETSSKNHFQDHSLNIDGKILCRKQRSKSESNRDHSLSSSETSWGNTVWDRSKDHSKQHRYEPSFENTHQKWQERTKFFQVHGGCTSKVDSFKDPWVPKVDSFQDPCWKSQKIKSQIYGPYGWGKSSYSRASVIEVNSTSERTALKRSITKRIEIQPYLCRARFNIYQKYQGSSSFIPPTALTALMTCQENTTSKQTWQSHQFNTEDIKVP